MVGAAALGAVFLYLQRWLLIGCSRRIEYDLRNDLFRHVQRLDVSFFGRTRAGDLMARFTNDLGALRDVVGPGLMYAFSMTVTLALSIALMIAIDARLTLIAFAPYPLISLVTFFFSRALHTRSRRVQDAFGLLSARVQEDLAGTRVLRAYAQEDSRALAFRELNEEYLAANMAVARLRGLFIAAMGALAGSGLAIALLAGGRMVMEGRLSLGGLVAFSAYLAELTWPVVAVGFVIGMLQRGAGAAARIDGLLAARPEIAGGPVTARPRPRIEFERVSFRYPGARVDALLDISFRVGAGRTLGVVGRTGSGKSTLLKLILRLHDPSAGRILLDGLDLRERSLYAARAIAGYAPQDAFLFSRSLCENIAYGVPDADPDSVARAASRALLDDDLAHMPRGLATLLGERGVTLSGGQRQRASLARALLLEPDLLLLDDTLSSVDAGTEAAIVRELLPFMAERTTIIVSHRISAVQAADHILVLDDGRVVEEGHHSALAAGGGLYARLHERQRLAAEIEGAG